MFAVLQLLVLVDWLLIAVACYGAWRWGGRPERGGAALVLVVLGAFVLAGLVRGDELVRGLYLALDGLFALGLLLLAMRYVRRWLGVALLLQGVQFSLHAYYLVASRRYDNLYILVNNLVSFGVVASLLFGVVLAWRAQRAAK